MQSGGNLCAWFFKQEQVRRSHNITLRLYAYQISLHWNCVQSRQYLFHLPDIVFVNCQMFNLLIEKLSACMIYTVFLHIFINTCIRYLMEWVIYDYGINTFVDIAIWSNFCVIFYSSIWKNPHEVIGRFSERWSIFLINWSPITR